MPPPGMTYGSKKSHVNMIKDGFEVQNEFERMLLYLNLGLGSG